LLTLVQNRRICSERSGDIPEITHHCFRCILRSPSRYLRLAGYRARSLLMRLERGLTTQPPVTPRRGVAKCLRVPGSSISPFNPSTGAAPFPRSHFLRRLGSSFRTMRSAPSRNDRPAKTCLIPDLAVESAHAVRDKGRHNAARSISTMCSAFGREDRRRAERASCRRFVLNFLPNTVATCQGGDTRVRVPSGQGSASIPSCINLHQSVRDRRVPRKESHSARNPLPARTRPVPSARRRTSVLSPTSNNPSVQIRILRRHRPSQARA
jgi:hypothetical protein